MNVERIMTMPESKQRYEDQLTFVDRGGIVLLEYVSDRVLATAFCLNLGIPKELAPYLIEPQFREQMRELIELYIDRRAG